MRSNQLVSRVDSQAVNWTRGRDKIEKKKLEIILYELSYLLEREKGYGQSSWKGEIAEIAHFDFPTETFKPSGYDHSRVENVRKTELYYRERIKENEEKKRKKKIIDTLSIQNFKRAYFLHWLFPFNMKINVKLEIIVELISQRNADKTIFSLG